MKMKMKNIPVMGMAGSLVGGAAAGYASEKLLNSVSTNVYIQCGILAAVGAALNVFVKNDLVAGVGNGMLAVAGQKVLGTGGLGLYGLPSQNALSGLPSQKAIGAAKWVEPKTVKVPVKKTSKNVQ